MASASARRRAERPASPLLAAESSRRVVPLSSRTRAWPRSASPEALRRRTYSSSLSSPSSPTSPTSAPGLSFSLSVRSVAGVAWTAG
ncbi:hypothetical protein Micbo1qcDRAFT_167724, partial [Microdochium bolleyi]